VKLRIMAVDDEPEILELLKAHIEWMGCDFVEVSDSREAAHRLLDEKIDGLFVDVRMPNVDGFLLTQMARMSKLNSRVPVVMLTGSDNGETMRKGFAAGANFFLGKPFTRESIYNLIKATRGLMRRERQRYARLPYRTAVNFTLQAASEIQRCAFSIDISEGGMLLTPSPGLGVGLDISISFTLPGGSRPTNAKAKVVRVAPPQGTGINFADLADRDQKELQGYILARLEEDAENKQQG
jgi:DNA-binding response OmpR family regulator